MAQRAGRVGVNSADVNPVTGHINVQVPGNVYTKTQVDNKFLTKAKAVSDYQTKELAVPIEMLDGTKLTVETALQGLNTNKANVNGWVQVGNTITIKDENDENNIGYLYCYENVEIHMIALVVGGTSNHPASAYTVHIDYDEIGFTEIPVHQFINVLRNGDYIMVNDISNGKIDISFKTVSWVGGSLVVPTKPRTV